MIYLSMMKICLVQTTSYKDGKEYNLERAGKAIKAAAETGASLVVFPEMYLTGYMASRRVASLCEPADGPSEVVMAGYASKYGVHLIYGYPEIRDGVVYNSANFIDDKGNLIGTYSKSRLFLDEYKAFTPGNEWPVFETSLGKVGILICYDIEFPEPARRLAAKGADFIVCIAANMLPYKELHRRFSIVRSLENSLPIAYCNYTGSDNRFEYCGRSALYEPDGDAFCGVDGKKLVDGDCEEGLIFADLDLEKYKLDGPAYDYLSLIGSDERKLYTS